MILQISCDSRTTAYQINEQLGKKIPKWLSHVEKIGAEYYVVVEALFPGEENFHSRFNCNYTEELDGSWDLTPWSNTHLSLKEFYAHYYTLKSLSENPNVL